MANTTVIYGGNTTNHTGSVQGFDMQIQGLIKDYSMTKIKIFKELQTNIHSACVHTQEA